MENTFLYRKENIKKKKETLKNEFINHKGYQKGLYQNNLKIKSIQSNISLYENKITNFKIALDEIEKNYKKKEKILKDIQKKATTKNKEKSNLRYKSIINDVKKLENDLEKKQKKISNVKSENYQLRYIINNLRKEKNIYKNICENVDKEVETLQDNYILACKKLKKLENHKKIIEKKINKDEKENEKEEYLATLGYLTIKKQLMSNKSLLNSGFKTKNQMINQISEKNLKNDLLNQYFLQNSLTPKNNYNLKSNLYNPEFKKSKNTLKTKSQKKSVLKKSSKSIKYEKSENKFKKEEEDLKNKLNEYKKLYDIIFSETGTQNVEEFLNYYMNLEEENQEYYKETKQLIEEINDSKDQKLSMQIELKEILSSKQKKKSLKEKIISEMKNDLERIDEKLKNVENKKKGIKKSVQTLKLSIPVIIDRLLIKDKDKEKKNESNSLNDLDKKNNYILHNNEVPEFLHKLEKRTNEILKMVKDNQLQSRVFDCLPNKNVKIKQDKLLKNHFFNIEEIKKIHICSKKEEENNSILSRDEIKKSFNKDIDSFFKKTDRNK